MGEPNKRDLIVFDFGDLKAFINRAEPQIGYLVCKRQSRARIQTPNLSVGSQIGVCCLSKGNPTFDLLIWKTNILKEDFEDEATRRKRKATLPYVATC